MLTTAPGGLGNHNPRREPVDCFTDAGLHQSADPWAGPDLTPKSTHCAPAKTAARPAVSQPGRLAPEHRAKLRESALTDQQIDALGWSSEPDGRLRIPYVRPDGTPEQRHDGNPFIRWRLSSAEIKANPDGGKYRSPKGNGCRIYHPALAIAAGNYEERLADRYIPLRLTEGEAKTESATAHDPKRLTIGLGGVSSWRDRYDDPKGPSRPLVDFDEIELEGREVRLCFDSDFNKPQVAAELRGLAEMLDGRGARVLIEVLPNGLDGARLGVDDLIYRHGARCFQRIAAIARSPFKIRRKDGEDVKEWAFNPEPLDTRERNTYLAGLVGNHWRRSADGKDRWQQWTGSHWADVAGDDELSAAIEWFAELQGWKNRELATFRSLQAAFRRTIGHADTAAASGLVPFRNGCLRLADGALVDHAPEHGNTWSLPYDYDPGARCPGIEAFITDRLGDADSVALFRGFGRSLLTGAWVKSFLEITGPSNTGKSILANLLVALVGAENHAAMKLHRLEDASQRFETIKLRGKRLAVFSECQDYSGQLQNLKSLTGGDSIAAEIKGGRHIDFTFNGGAVLIGNGPIRASDPTGAVVNRRRSLHVGKVVDAGDERQLLEPDGAGGWRGELVPELPGFINWLLAMPAAAARQALARDVQSLSRMESELTSLLETDYLAEWCDRRLIWDASINEASAASGFDQRLTIGTAKGDPEHHLYASYLAHMGEQGQAVKPLSLRVFKSKLVDLLRDTLSLPLPPGQPSVAAAYRSHSRGSLVPCLRWRIASDADAPGVVRQAFQSRISTAAGRMDQQATGMDGGWIPDGKNPVRDLTDGSDGFSETQAVSTAASSPPPPPDPVFPIAATTAPNPSESIRSVRCKGSQRPESIPSDGSIHPGRRPTTPGAGLIALAGAMDRNPGATPAELVQLADPTGRHGLTVELVMDVQQQAVDEFDEFGDEPAPAPAPAPSPPSPTGRPVTVDGMAGYRLPGVLPTARTAKVVVVDASGHSRCVERSQVGEVAA